MICRRYARSGIAEVAERRLDDVERKLDAVALPVLPDAAGLIGVEREEDSSDVVELERARVGECPQRRAVHAGDEHASDGPLCDRALTGDERVRP